MRKKSEDKPSKKIRYAVVGLGYIAQAAVLPAFEHARENSELVALVSGDIRKLAELSKKYDVTRTYTYENFADCVESGEVDAVYIALPNSMHRMYTEAAARAGVHVLCEKPMAETEQDCEAMIAAAESAKIKLMIAYRLHFEAANLKAIEIANSGDLGNLRIFNSVFTMQVKPGNIRIREDLSGGPLSDVGIYCINAARYLFKTEPEEVFATHAAAKSDSRFEEVPEMTAATIKFPGDRLATFTCSFGAADRSTYEVLGTKGRLQLDPAYELAEALKLELTVDGRTRKQTFRKRDQFAPELVYFSDCIIRDKTPEPSGYEGMADIRIITALNESAETRRSVTISQKGPEKRPSSSQEITRPPIQMPQLVKAAAPSKGE